jgi:hypothetical protein
MATSSAGGALERFGEGQEGVFQVERLRTAQRRAASDLKMERVGLRTLAGQGDTVPIEWLAPRDDI